MASRGVQEPIYSAEANPIRLREVDYQESTGRRYKLLLVEMRHDGSEISADRRPYFSPIARAIARIRFGTVTDIRAFAGRLLVDPPEPPSLIGSRLLGFEYDAAPPGLGMSQKSPLDVPQGIVDPAFLGGNVPANVEGAIGWFVAGMHETLTPKALMCFWLGIEMLAPEIRGPLHCPNQGCGKPIPTCPTCRNATTSPKATKSIIDYLAGDHGLTRKEASKMYQARNDVAHGRVRLDPKGIEDISQQVRESGKILLSGIKMKLGWPQDRPPILSDVAIFKRLELGIDQVAGEDFSYDLPLNAPYWETFKHASYQGLGRGVRGLAGFSD